MITNITSLGVYYILDKKKRKQLNKLTKQTKRRRLYACLLLESCPARKSNIVCLILHNFKYDGRFYYSYSL